MFLRKESLKKTNFYLNIEERFWKGNLKRIYQMIIYMNLEVSMAKRIGKSVYNDV